MLMGFGCCAKVARSNIILQKRLKNKASARRFLAVMEMCNSV